MKIPHDPVNEQVVLAAAIVDAAMRKKLVASLSADSFYGKGHPEAWGMLVELERRCLAYDPATVQQLSGGAVDTDYLDELVRQRPEVPANLSHHVASLLWDRSRVEAVRGPLGQLLEALRDITSDPERVRALARGVGQAFEGGAGARRFLRDPNVLVREQMDSVRARRAGGAWYPYGLPGLDLYGPGDIDHKGHTLDGRRRLVVGVSPKLITCITGLSGSGKTTVTAQIAVALANQGRRTLYGAWEQDSGPTLELCAATSLGLSRSALQEGTITDDDEAALEREMDRLAAFLVFFDVPFGRERGADRGKGKLNDRHLDTIHQAIADSGVEVCIFDLWRRALREMEPDEEEQALYRQQAIHKETNTHGILIHQQRLKDIETRPDKRPTREGLKGSGAWIEVPDTILGVHRPALWKSVEDDTLEIDVLKQRQGPWPLAVEFDWDPDTGIVINGRGIEYARPGERGAVDSFLDAPPEPQGKSNQRSKRGRDRGGR